MFFGPKRIHQLGGYRQRSDKGSSPMTDITSVFEKLDLTGYIEVFVDNGFDTWEDVLDITESDLETLGVKIGHRRRLQREIATQKGITIDQVISSVPRDNSVDDSLLVETESRTSRSDNIQPVGTGKRRYRRHPRPDKNAPERPPSAYVLFSNQVREELKPQNLSFTDIAKIVGERWQQLDTNGREPYESQATGMKDGYNAKLAEYKKTDEWRDYQEYLQAFKAAQAQNTGSTGDGKRLKLEKTGESSHGSSRGSVGTPSTSAHGSPISMASSGMHPPMPDSSNATSSPTAPGGFAVYSQMVSARSTATPPLRTPNISQTISEHSAVFAPPQSTFAPTGIDVSRALPRRSNNPAAPYLQHHRDKHDTSTGSISSHHSSVSQGSSVYTPLTPVETGASGYIGSRPVDGENTPTHTQQSMNRLSIGTLGGNSPAASLSNIPPPPSAFGAPPLPPPLGAEAASRILPLPQQPSGYPQTSVGMAPIPPQSQHISQHQNRGAQAPSTRMDGLSVLALAGKMVDGGSGPHDQKPKPP